MTELLNHIKQAARVLFRPGDLIEVRVPNARNERTISGYFRDLDRLAEAVVRLDARKFPGVYWTLNPINPDLIARADHKVLPYAKATTSDADVLSRLWLPVDLDPKRPAEISSSDAEHDAALLLADRMIETLSAEQWPEPVAADSGNGGHLLYAVDLPNDEESLQLIQRVLKGLQARFGTEGPPRIDIDCGMFNASRIAKIYGTMARKGDDTKDRPHRRSRLLHAPSEVRPVPPELLRQMAALAPADPRQQAQPRSGGSRSFSGPPPKFDVVGFLSKHGIRHRGAKPYEGGYKYVLEECPFDSSHKAPDSAVFELADGSLGFRCLHASCHGRAWKDFREHFEGPRQPFQPRPAYQPTATAPVIAPEAAEPDAEDKKLAQALREAEEAADIAIESRSSAEVMRLAAAVAKLRPMHQAVIVAKLRDGFKDEWKALEKWFEKALKDAAAPAASAPDQTGQNRVVVPPAGGGSEADGAAPPPDLLGYPLTDSGNAERIVAMFGHEIRYCVEMKSWFRWDGKRWAIDRTNIMRGKAQEMARMLYYQASQMPEGGRRTAIDKHARASESSRGITNALMEAERMPGIPVSAQQLDQHADLLNFRNGTVCLRDGTLRPHDRSQLITKLCEHDYRPQAKCPLFQTFVEWAMGGPVDGNPDAELSEMTVRLVNFVQRVIGYSITGDVRETAVFVFYGLGANGKTLLLTTFRELLGADYASLLLIDTIMHAKSTDNTAREDMADLRGARFVQTSEVSKEDRLNEQRIKFLTQGMGTIKSRRLHEHLVEFTATHKLLMDCNYRPKVQNQDNGIWRRLIQIPFLATIAEDKKDTALPQKLRAEAEGILAWAVRGAIEWYKNGLGKPPEVMEAQQDWREHDDPLREFLSDFCTVEEGLFVPVKDLMSAYLLWCREYGEKFPLARRSFNEALVGKGMKQDRKAIANVTTRIWVGCELKVEVMQKLRRISGQGEFE